MRIVAALAVLVTTSAAVVALTAVAMLSIDDGTLYVVIACLTACSTAACALFGHYSFSPAPEPERRRLREAEKRGVARMVVDILVREGKELS